MQTQMTNYPADKKQLYPLLVSQLSGLIQGVPHRIANLANASALLMEASNSEIVLPLHAGGKVVGVMDIDSPSFARFDEEDREGLANFAQILEKVL